MSVRRQAIDAAVKLAVDATCQQLGIHGACPIAQALVEMAVKRAREPSDNAPKVPVPTGDRSARPVRPEERKDKISKLVPEEAVFKFPDVLSMPSTAPMAAIVRSAVLRGMATHVTQNQQGSKARSGVAGGGKVTQSIVHRITAGGRTRREDQKGTGDQPFFTTEGSL